MTSGHLNRRQLLAALAAGGLLPTFSVCAAEQTPQVLTRWSSGNNTLVPLALHDGQIIFGGERTLGRIDPGSNAVMWNVAHQLPGALVYRPRAAGQRVITGGQRALGAWGLGDGQALWQREALVQLGTPYVTPEQTYVGDGHELLALDNRSGALVWRFAGTTDTLASYAPTVAGDSVFFGPGNGLLYALNRANGKLKWQLDDSDEWQYVRQMYVSGNVLVAGTYTELLYGIHIETGKVLWKFKAGNFINSHYVSGDAAYLWSPTGWVYCIDIQRGTVRWRHQTSRYGNTAANWGPLMAELVSFEDKLYCLDMNQVLHVLALNDGQELMRIAFDRNLRPTVGALQGKRVVLATEAGEIQLVQW